MKKLASTKIQNIENSFEIKRQETRNNSAHIQMVISKYNGNRKLNYYNGHTHKLEKSSQT